MLGEFPGYISPSFICRNVLFGSICSCVVILCQLGYRKVDVGVLKEHVLTVPGMFLLPALSSESFLGWLEAACLQEISFFSSYRIALALLEQLLYQQLRIEWLESDYHLTGRRVKQGNIDSVVMLCIGNIFHCYF